MTVCNACGKPLKYLMKTIKVLQGQMLKEQKSPIPGAPILAERFSETREWGMYHNDCFSKHFESPATALEKIKDLAEPTVVISGPTKKSKK
jgi:hypothetical protein